MKAEPMQVSMSPRRYLELVAIKEAHIRLVKYLIEMGYSEIQNSPEMVEVYGLEPRREN